MDRDTLRLFTSLTRAQLLMLNLVGSIAEALADQIGTEDLEKVTSVVKEVREAHNTSIDMLDEIISKYKAQNGAS